MKLHIILSVLISLCASGLIAQQKAAPQKRAPSPSLAPVQDVAGLPRVLLIGDSISINEIARRVMAENGVKINDLNSQITPRLEELQNPRDVHFKSAGYEFLAQKVAPEIEAALAKD